VDFKMETDKQRVEEILWKKKSSRSDNLKKLMKGKGIWKNG